MKIFPFLALLFMTLTNITFGQSLLEKAQKIHNNIITLDTHIDINVKNFTDSINYSQRLDSQVNIPKMNEGGLDVAWLIVYTKQDSLNTQGYLMAYENAISKFKAIHRLAEEYAPNDIELALTSNTVREIHAKGKKTAMIGVENGYPIGTDISNVKKFHELGARYMSLAHNGHSQLSDSHTGEEDGVWLHHGLSKLGKQVLIEMNRYGIMIDASHPSKEAVKQMIALSKAPIIASHSSARALCNHSRNLDDELLLLLKENGGVAQTVAFSSYLNTQKDTLYRNAVKPLYEAIAKEIGVELIDPKDFGNKKDIEIQTYFENLKRIKKIADKDARMQKINKTTPPVSVEDLADHIDYMVKLIGIDHVGISSDFDGGGGIDGWGNISETFNVTLELVKRGYSENQISKLWSENLLRVLDEVQKVAQDIQKRY